MTRLVYGGFDIACHGSMYLYSFENSIHMGLEGLNPNCSQQYLSICGPLGVSVSARPLE